MIHRRLFLKAFVLSPIALAMACSDTVTATKLPKQSKVAALGDSLTVGYGAGRGQDYPSVLAQLTGWNISNMGVNGDTSAQVLSRLQAVIDESPKLVLLSIGGNDVLRNIHPDKTTANIIAIIKNLQHKNIPVVLIAQPYLSMSVLFGQASDNPIYEQIADELTIPLLAKAWSKILSDERLKSDKIHANAEGYQQFARILFDYLKQLGYA